MNIRPSDYPWITCHIISLIRKRQRVYNKFKKTNTCIIYFWNQFKVLRNKITNLIRKSKQDYFDKLESMFTNENLNAKLFWKTYIKQLLRLGKTTNNIPKLSLNNEYAETDLQKANMLNKYLNSSQSIVDNNNKSLPQPETVLHDRLGVFEITPQSVKDVLDGLDVNKSCGPDLMSPRLLKDGYSVLAELYSLVVTSSVRLGQFPTPWKDGNTQPYTKKDRSLPSNYRPVSLLCQPGKSLERCVHKELYNNINEHKVLTPFQSGFVPGDSTTFQLLHTYHMFCEAVGSGKEVRAVFCDISKAFDMVWHRELIHKLRDIGCSDAIIKWFSSYLSNRRQRVVLNGQTSEWTFVKDGVPQSSIHGPLLLFYLHQ